MSLDLEAIQARAERATGGPWEVTEVNQGVCYVQFGGAAGDTVCRLEWVGRASAGDYDTARNVRDADACFIAHAREDVPALLAHCRAQAAEIERLQEEIERLQPFEAPCGAYARDAKRQAEEAWPA